MLLQNENYLPQSFLLKESSSNEKSESSKQTDSFLWEEFKLGDELAFINIYKKYANMLINYGCQFTKDRELVKDCLQDFFIYLRKSRKGLGRTNSIKMYLFKAFRRRVIDYLKKDTKTNRQSEAFSLVAFPVELCSESIYINRQIEVEQLNRLNKGLRCLNEKEREAIYCFYYECLSYEEIATILGYTHTHSARRLIYRALSKLRKFF